MPKAKNPKEEIHACQDALITVFKGHMVAALCKEFHLLGADDDITDVEVNLCNLSSVVQKVVDKHTIVSEALLGSCVVDTGDGIYNYARVICHYASLVCEFVDAWSEGDGE